MNNQKTADTAAILSWAAWFAANLAQINEILQFFALVVAIISGTCAAFYHVRKIRGMR